MQGHRALMKAIGREKDIEMILVLLQARIAIMLDDNSVTKKIITLENFKFTALIYFYIYL